MAWSTSWTSWSTVLVYVCLWAVLAESAAGLHSRHNRAGRRRRVPEPIPDPVGQAFGEVSEQQQNQHKPVFENCENYQPSVNEEAQRGRRQYFPAHINFKGVSRCYIVYLTSETKRINRDFNSEELI
jgi:hypothetical protein